MVVADKGLNSGDNIAFNTALGDGYIYSQSVRGGSAQLQTYVLDEKGYVSVGADYKKKSRVVSVKIQITAEDKGNGKRRKTKQIEIDQKQVIFYSKKYADRAKHQRDEILKKACDLIANPSKYNRATSYGAASYVKGIVFDKETGEITEPEKILGIDTDKIGKEERLDGYYAIVTSELDETDERIIELYRGLWRIEESFKITKCGFAARPVYLSREDHIDAHFLTCFISLVILRIIEFRLEHKFPPCRILESIRSVCCSNVDENLWLFDYIDQVTAAINIKFDLNIGMKFMKLHQIREYFGMTKNN